MLIRKDITTSGDITLSSGDLKIRQGDLTVESGDLTVSSGDVFISGLTDKSVPFVSSGQLVEDNAGLNYDTANKRLGIGGIASRGKLHVLDNAAVTSGTAETLYIDQQVKPTGASTASNICLNLNTYNGQNNNITDAAGFGPTAIKCLSTKFGFGNDNAITGMQASVQNLFFGTISLARAAALEVRTQTLGTITDARCMDAAVTHVANSTVTTAAAFYARLDHQGFGTITSNHMFYADTPSINLGAVTNQYGLYLKNQGNALATTSYQIYSEIPSGSTNNYGAYLGGNVGLGVTTPTAQLHVQTAAAGTVASIVKGAGSQTANLTEWQDSTATVLSSIDKVGAWNPPSMADSTAANNSVYYSTTASKLVYKDGAGTVNNLY